MHEVLWSDVEPHYWRISGPEGPDAEEIVDFLEQIGVAVIGAPHLQAPRDSSYVPGPLDGLVQQVYDTQIKDYLTNVPAVRRFVP